MPLARRDIPKLAADVAKALADGRAIRIVPGREDWFQLDVAGSIVEFLQSRGLEPSDLADRLGMLAARIAADISKSANGQVERPEVLESSILSALEQSATM